MLIIKASYPNMQHENVFMKLRGVSRVFKSEI